MVVISRYIYVKTGGKKDENNDGNDATDISTISEQVDRVTDVEVKGMPAQNKLCKRKDSEMIDENEVILTSKEYVHNLYLYEI